MGFPSDFSTFFAICSFSLSEGYPWSNWDDYLRMTDRELSTPQLSWLEL